MDVRTGDKWLTEAEKQWLKKEGFKDEDIRRLGFLKFMVFKARITDDPDRREGDPELRVGHTREKAGT